MVPWGKTAPSPGPNHPPDSRKCKKGALVANRKKPQKTKKHHVPAITLIRVGATCSRVKNIAKYPRKGVDIESCM